MKQTFRGRSEYVTSGGSEPQWADGRQRPATDIVAQWDLVRPQVPRQQRGHFMSISSVVYSPDGKTIVSAAATARSSSGTWRRGAGQAFFGHVGGAANAVTSTPIARRATPGDRVRQTRSCGARRDRLREDQAGRAARRTHDYVNVVAFSPRRPAGSSPGSEDSQAGQSRSRSRRQRRSLLADGSPRLACTAFGNVAGAAGSPSPRSIVLADHAEVGRPGQPVLHDLAATVTSGLVQQPLLCGRRCWGR